MLSGCFYGNRMHTAVNKFLQGIIHKAVTGHPGDACKARGGDFDTKMRAKSASIDPHMTGVLTAFVDDLKPGGRESLLQLSGNLVGNQ